MILALLAGVPYEERHAGQDDELLEPAAICVWGWFSESNQEDLPSGLALGPHWATWS